MLYFTAGNISFLWSVRMLLSSRRVSDHFHPILFFADGNPGNTFYILCLILLIITSVRFSFQILLSRAAYGSYYIDYIIT